MLIKRLVDSNGDDFASLHFDGLNKHAVYFQTDCADKNKIVAIIGYVAELKNWVGLWFDGRNLCTMMSFTDERLKKMVEDGVLLCLHEQDCCSDYSRFEQIKDRKKSWAYIFKSLFTQLEND